MNCLLMDYYNIFLRWDEWAKYSLNLVCQIKKTKNKISDLCKNLNGKLYMYTTWTKTSAY